MHPSENNCNGNIGNEQQHLSQGLVLHVTAHDEHEQQEVLPMVNILVRSTCTTPSDAIVISSDLNVNGDYVYVYQIHDLPHEILKHCFTFVGEGYFRYIGAISKCFRISYCELYAKCTMMTSVGMSLPCLQIFVAESESELSNPSTSTSPTRKEQFRLIWQTGVRHGCLDVLKWVKVHVLDSTCSTELDVSATANVNGDSGHNFTLEEDSDTDSRDSAVADDELLDLEEIRFRDIFPRPHDRLEARMARREEREMMRRGDGVPTRDERALFAREMMGMGRGNDVRISFEADMARREEWEMMRRGDGVPTRDEREGRFHFAHEMMRRGNADRISFREWSSMKLRDRKQQDARRYRKSLLGEWATAEAASRGYSHMLEWLLEQGCPWKVTTEEMLKAVERGCLTTVKLASEKGCKWDIWTCYTAALNGHFDIFQWALANGCPCDDTFTTANLAQNGELETLKVARKYLCPWDERTCANAAENGHLEVLKWAKENGCPWDEWTCTNAAANGHLEVLRWARDHKCPWSDKTYCRAKSSGNSELFEYVQDQGCPCSPSRISYHNVFD